MPGGKVNADQNYEFQIIDFRNAAGATMGRFTNLTAVGGINGRSDRR
jgi:hypothetical protein